MIRVLTGSPHGNGYTMAGKLGIIVDTYKPPSENHWPGDWFVVYVGNRTWTMRRKQLELINERR